jgi:glutamyl-tRNA reductase
MPHGTALPIHVIGTSHHSTPVEIRERFAFSPAEAEAALRQLIAHGARESVLLSTCNRTELYVTGGDDAIESGFELLAARAGLETIEAKQYLMVESGEACADHLFRVVSGMDSLVVGEAQIQGQVKQAYDIAVHTRADHKVVGAELARLFQLALAIGGRIRSETGLGTGSASVPGAAVALSKKVLGRLRGKRVLVIGAGHMSALVLKHLEGEDVASITVASRTRATAEHLAQRFNARSAVINELPLLLATSDLVITATSCPTTILSVETMRAALRYAQHALCLVDIALPRDVDPRVGDLDDVFLFDIDDLRKIVTDNLARRHLDWPLAEQLISAGVVEYRKWYDARTAVPLIKRLRDEAEHVRLLEVEKALQGLEHLSPTERQKIEQLSQQLINKVLHGPTVRLRAAAASEDGAAVLAAARYLFE